MITNFQITNVDCEACIKVSMAVLQNLPGVKKVEINKDGSAKVEAEDSVTWEIIKNSLAEVDKKAELI